MGVWPDGRDFFLYGTGSGVRTGHVPLDSDGDGLFHEDGPDDLNGNGVIEQIRKFVPGDGTHRLNQHDPRLMEAVGGGPLGEGGLSWATTRTSDTTRDKGYKGHWFLAGRGGSPMGYYLVGSVFIGLGVAMAFSGES